MFQVSYTYTGGSSVVKSGLSTLQAAKEAATQTAKANSYKYGRFDIVDQETFKLVSSFVFPPPPPLEGWVDVPQATTPATT